MKAVKNFWSKYKHGAWIFIYLIFYMLGFFIVESAGHRHYHVIHSVLDDMIPFNEYFVIPYLLWFVFVAGWVLWFVFGCRNKAEYYKLISVLAIGMTIFLVVSCVYPNCQDLRPTAFLHHNFFTRLVERLYASDTPTNVLPSIHVFNSLAVFFAVNSSEQLKKHGVIRFLTGVMAGLIILSTMFLKQHSVVDVSMGLLMGIAVQMCCDRVFAGETEKKGAVMMETTSR